MRLNAITGEDDMGIASALTTVTANRETWLRQVADEMAPKFEDLGFPLPQFRAAIGFPFKAENATGQCWDKSVSADGHFEVFINPGRDDSRAIASTMAHELAHMAAGLDQGHKGHFATLVRGLGFKGRLTNAQDLDAAPTLAAWIDGILAKIGPIPHAALALRSMGGDKLTVRVGGGMSKAPAADGDNADGEPQEGRISSGPKPQTGRMLKACCGAEGCGYTVRVTAKWLEVGPPHCPLHGAMTAET